MATFHDSYVGLAPEVTYGTFVAPTNFVEFASEGITGRYERIEAEGIRAGTDVLRSDRFAVNPKGAEGDLSFEVLNKGFDTFLKAMLGAASTVTGTTTATLGDLKGTSLSVKVGRVTSAGVITPFDYSGGKVASWELSNAVDGILMANLSMDFAKEATGGSAATPTYVAGSQLLTFVGGTVQIGGTDFAVSDVSVTGDNALKVDRYALRGANSTTKREPLTEGLRQIGFTLRGEFEDMTHYNRVAAATAAAAVGAVSLAWTAPAGGSLTVTIPAGRFDEAPVNVSGATVIEQSLTGKALDNGTDEPITIVYVAGA